MSQTVTRSLQLLQAPGCPRLSVAHYQAPGRSTALIVCPGFFKSKETPVFRRLSERLAQEDDVVCLDFRGHGRSGGRYTFSAQEPCDLRAVLEWARPRYARLGVVGFSLGAAIAITTLSRQAANVRSLMTVSAPAAFDEIEFKWWMPEAIRRGIQGLEPGAGCRPGSPWLPKERPVEHIGKLAPMPILLVHGTNDVIVDVRHSWQLYAAAAEPKRLEIIEGGSHAEALFRDDPEGFCRLVRTWFARTLHPALKGGVHSS